MANHGQQVSEKRRTRHYAKPSRQKRHERRWDARVQAMRDDLAQRERDRAAEAAPNANAA